MNNTPVPSSLTKDEISTLFTTGYNELLTFNPAPSGQLLVNTNDEFMYDLISRYGEYCEGEMEICEDLLEVTGSDSIVVEVGANIGMHTVALAQMVPHGMVLAFEPQRFPYFNLVANIALSSLPNVEPYQVAVGKEVGSTNILTPSPYHHHQSGGFTLNPLESSGRPVRVITIDSLELPRLDLLTIDVEGSEASVLSGAEMTITEYKPAIYLEYQWNREEIASHLKRWNYRMIPHQPPYYRENNFLHADPVDAYRNVISNMLLCVHESRFEQFSHVIALL